MILQKNQPYYDHGLFEKLNIIRENRKAGHPLNCPLFYKRFLKVVSFVKMPFFLSIKKQIQILIKQLLKLFDDILYIY